ncbi:hypothetical protein AFR_29835 [Actinoplanes friuliensis DSM 7358]|uniref:Secreted protein n=1 Tax=Actinoplanes friuliensis DSM 7358 TaxID=1246995 RepID=U5W4V0_9ACTN|nr:hypothetical protein AFR_29835 [Actinoplanes friuliensis DSM 7358]
MSTLIFLDVDGPLIPFGPRPDGHRGPPPHATADHPLLHRLNPADGPRLLALGAELVWATTWMREANEIIAPLLGLPQLPVADWPDDEPPAGLHWKTAGLVAWAAGRSFTWIDDEITDTDRRWVAAHHPGPALLHRVDPRAGLTDADFTVLRAGARLGP